MRVIALVLCLLATAGVAWSQEPPKAAPPATPENPLSGFARVAFGQLKVWLLSSAEKMPEADYGFRPADSVRTYGQILGHVADSQYLFCSAIRGEKNPAPRIEQTKTSKADLIAALKDAFAYCDPAFDGMTDANASRIVELRMGKAQQLTKLPQLAVLLADDMHGFEHYGNLVTYLRIKNIVPPSSDVPAQPPPAPAPSQPKKERPD